MFSFHKPKIYRSPAGCCICRAKSSSSRFTDSKKYETDFLSCFQLEVTRIGEICNACVLLVKRWQKLPKGSSRHWSHVVDARAGPGLKSMNKCKKIEIAKQEDITKVRRKHVYKRKKKRLFNRSDSPMIPSDDAGDGAISDASSCPERLLTSTMTKEVTKKKNDEHDADGVSSFVDLTYWKRKEICCGMIYVGLAGEFMIDHKFYTPCSAQTHGEVVKPDPSAQSAQTIQSIIESELKLCYEKSELEIDDSEDFYSDASNEKLKNGDAATTDIDEGFFDKPTTSPKEKSSDLSLKSGLNSFRKRRPSSCA